MYIQNRVAALLFRCLLLTGCALGLFVFLGFPAGSLDLSTLIFYTNLSNLVCFIYFFALAARTALDIRREGVGGCTVVTPRFKGAITMMISVTMLVYHFMLSNGGFVMTNNVYPYISLANKAVHYFTPLMVILDWLLFDRKNKHRWFDPLLWLSIPLVYFLFVLIRAKIGGVIPRAYSRYPYFFLDVDLLGWAGVLKYVAVITVACAALGYIILLVDKIPLANEKTALNRQA